MPFLQEETKQAIQLYIKVTKEAINVKVPNDFTM